MWSRDATFLGPDGRVQYFAATGVTGTEGAHCTDMDPILFTEAITSGPLRRQPTLSPYEACRRPGHFNATGARHIVHHMLFQRDVMADLHAVVAERWGASSLWEAATRCHQMHNFCQSRIAEYELYFAFAKARYPERIRVTPLTNGRDYMGSSAICDAEELACCRERGVLLKGCHDHRIALWQQKKATNPGDMCCPWRANGRL